MNLVNTLEIIEGKKFRFKDWNHSGSGGGTMGSIKGEIIEKYLDHHINGFLVYTDDIPKKLNPKWNDERGLS